MNDTERLFHGIPLTDATAAAIERSLRAGPDVPGRIAPPGNWHVTIRFLGATDADRKGELIRLMNAAELPAAFDAPLTGWGAFPRSARATVLWVGLEDAAGRMAGLARTAEAVARAVGFPPDERPFTPHVTIARFRRPTDVRRLLAGLSPATGILRVDRLVLFRSVLGNWPPRYEPITTHELRAPERRSG